jgi:photosystem II stability/assembly factor-like uncharacterized protein
VLAVAVAGCGGGGDGGDGGPTVALPAGVKGELFLALAVDPADRALFVSTDKSLLHIARGAKRAQLVRGTYREGLVKVALRRDSTATVVGPHRLLGSGHPGATGPVPQNLGLLVSNDGGVTWDPVSLTGTADLHILRVKVGGAWLYAYDYAHQRVVFTRDNGQHWLSHPAPGLVSDLAADPGNLTNVLASTDRGPLISTNAGADWRPFAQQDADRFLWPASNALYLFDRSGNVRRSGDAGNSATLVGAVGGPVAALTAVSATDLYALTKDGRVRRSRDGGKTWVTEMKLG